MIGKSMQLHYTEALVRRLSTDDLYYEFYLKQLANYEAGLFGETQLVDALLDFTTRSKHVILTNLQFLTPHGFSHQLDALLITPHFVLILEAKNMVGTLSYQPQHAQFLRSKLGEDTREVFSDPFAQCYRHKAFLQQLLLSQDIHVPVEYVVVLTNKRSVVDSSLRDYPILHLRGLQMYVDQLLTIHQQTVAPCDLVRATITNAIQEIPLRRAKEQFKLRRGVLCQECSDSTIMHYVHANWQCSVCGVRSKKALLHALNDYRLLISEHITNAAFRNFVGIESADVASKILKRLHLEAVGKNRGRYYIIPANLLD